MYRTVLACSRAAVFSAGPLYGAVTVEKMGRATEGMMSFVFTHVRVRGDRLYLREAGDRESAVHKRIEP